MVLHRAAPAGTDGKVEKLVLSVEEAGFALGVSARTIRNLLRRGELVRRKIGARTVIPRTSIEAFLRRDHPTKPRSE